MHLFFFGLDWSWTEDFGLSVQLREGSIPIVAVIFFVIIGLFLIFWFLPLELWNFGTNALDQKDTRSSGVLIFVVFTSTIFFFGVVGRFTALYSQQTEGAVGFCARHSLRCCCIKNEVNQLKLRDTVLQSTMVDFIRN